MDTSPNRLCDDSCSKPSCGPTNEESVYATSVPESSRLMIDLLQGSDGNDDEALVNEDEEESKLKTSNALAELCACELAGESIPIVKRKSGWPKGKKRKLVVDSCRVPKAPTTGYVIFLNERRKMYKTSYPELPFTEVTKLLGREWSNLRPNEKQKYLDKADADKKRYREELHSYQQTELVPDSSEVTKSTQAFVDLQDAVLGFEKAHDSEELYCNLCDQFFVSMHNKKEHFYGKLHLQAVTSAAGGLGNSSRQIAAHMRPSNVNQSILDFFEATFGRETEIKELRVQLGKSKNRNGNLLRKLGQLRILNSKLQGNLQRLKTEETGLKEQLHNLRMVTTLFGVIHFQH